MIAILTGRLTEVTLPVRDRIPGSNPYFKIEFLSGITGLRLVGEADLCVEGILKAAISALPADAATLHFQLAELRFIDVGNTGELVALAKRPSRPRLVLYCPPPMLTKMITLFWPETTPSFLVAAERGYGRSSARAFG